MKREVDAGAGVTQISVTRVGYNPDDGYGIGIGAHEPLANGVRTRPVASRGGFAEHHDRRGVLAVGGRESSTPQDRDPEGREVVRARSEEHTSELQSPYDLVCRLLLEKKNKKNKKP